MDQLRTSFPFLEQLSEQEIVDAARTAIETSLRDKTDILHLRMNDYLIRMEQLCGIFGIMRTKTKLAELSFEKIMSTHFPDYAFKKLHEDEWTINDNIFVSTKCYQSSVPVAQINRFRENIRSRGYQVGILAAYGSAIQGFRSLDIEAVGNNQFAIYLPEASEHSMPWAIRTAMRVHEFKSSVPVGVDRMQRMDQLIDAILTLLNKFRGTMQNEKNRMNEQFSNMENVMGQIILALSGLPK